MLCALSACEMQKLTPPTTLVAPHPADQLWAVAPFENESGVSVVNGARIADLFTYETEQTLGVRTVPVNRVMGAMQALGLTRVNSESDAIALLNVLDADGIIIGTVTAYDAFDPLQLGMAVELITRDHLNAREQFDPRELVRQAADSNDRRANALSIVQASGVFDASNHAVRQNLRVYATGRTVPDSAYGERIYNVSMEQYARFVSYELLSELLRAEAIRLLAVAADEPPS